MISANEYIFYL